MVFFGMKFKCLIFCQGFSHWKGKWLYVHQRIRSSQYFGRSWNNGYEHLKLFVCIFFNCLLIDFIFLLIFRKTGLEIIEQVPDVEAVVIPVGGGGLIAGCAVALKTMKPNIRIIVSYSIF